MLLPYWAMNPRRLRRYSIRRRCSHIWETQVEAYSAQEADQSANESMTPWQDMSLGGEDCETIEVRDEGEA